MSVESMKRALEPIRVYDMDSPNLNAELSAYAAELERLDGELDAILPERFISTATESGLSAYEELFGPSREELSVETRRNMLKKRFSLGGGDFTLNGIKQALDSFGLSYVIAEYPSLCRLNIIAQTDYSKAEQSFIKREVEKIIPAHIEYQLVFNTMTWDELDSINKTFTDLDNDDLTWELIDELSADE